MEMEQLSMPELAEKIDITVEVLKMEKSRITRAELMTRYLLLRNEYNERAGFRAYAFKPGKA